MRCCERDTDADGNCPLHCAPGMLRNEQLAAHELRNWAQERAMREVFVLWHVLGEYDPDCFDSIHETQDSAKLAAERGTDASVSPIDWRADGPALLGYVHATAEPAGGEWTIARITTHETCNWQRKDA